MSATVRNGRAGLLEAATAGTTAAIPQATRNHGCIESKDPVQRQRVQDGSSDWVLLAYRLPREPSSPRVGVWRKLRRLGVAQLLDGLVALPLDSRTREQLEWIADEVIEAGGEATVWVGQPGAAVQARALATRMAAEIASQYVQVQQDAEAAARGADGGRPRTLRRLRGELRRIQKRDFFPPPERDHARAAVEALGAAVEHAA
jgi:hypothetical protein